MRLIDADALVMHMADWQLSACSDKCDTIEEAIDAVTSAPIIDAVPVVRCRDCKFWQKTPSDILVRKCNVRSGYSGDTDFCSYGERKGNG